MGSYTQEPPQLFIETPCIPSAALSRAAGCNIFLKLENLQPSGSFKSRGVGTMMQRALPAKPAADGAAHFYCSSGGNAGLACATAAATLRQPCTIVVPLTTPARMIDKIRELGAVVLQKGVNWSMADRYLRDELLARDPKGIYVPPFDHPDIWDGASTLVDELVALNQVPDGAIDGIVCNCGGGGLLNGIMAGVERNGAAGAFGAAPDKPQVVVVETEGADSLHESVKAGKLIRLPAITSIATSLGASMVSEKTFEWSKEAHLTSVVVTDRDAVMGSVRFADDARILVEVACGATIAIVYNGMLREAMGKGLSDEEWSRKNVVVVVCGGSNVTLEGLRIYQETYKA
ncbi:L-serine dehydratase [Xylariaceae sp. FL0662B]|nr:L-serine dehydratase [Xylariaceae sp. FL0662B]